MEEREACPICLEDDQTIEWQVTVCNHRFHAKCLAGIRKDENDDLRCPMCRRLLEIEYPDDAEEESLEFKPYWGSRENMTKIALFGAQDVLLTSPSKREFFRGTSYLIHLSKDSGSVNF
jgi:hypothetical protein